MDPRQLRYGDVIGKSPQVISEWLEGQNLLEVLGFEQTRFKNSPEMLFMLYDVANLWSKSPHPKRLGLFIFSLEEQLNILLGSFPLIEENKPLRNVLWELSLLKKNDGSFKFPSESDLNEMTHWVLVYTLSKV